jgi:uncharacterized protein
MEKYSMYTLFIANLKDGLDRQESSVNPADLGLDEEEFAKPIQLHLDIEKVGQNIFVHARLQTELSFLCDRCAEPFSLAMSEQYRLLFTSDPDMVNEEDESTFRISESTEEVDLTDPLRETLLLAMPAKRICRDECKGLCAQCGANLNETTCTCEKQQIDPRWDKLKQLLK